MGPTLFNEVSPMFKPTVFCAATIALSLTTIPALAQPGKRAEKVEKSSNKEAIENLKLDIPTLRGSKKISVSDLNRIGRGSNPDGKLPISEKDAAPVPSLKQRAMEMFDAPSSKLPQPGAEKTNVIEMAFGRDHHILVSETLPEGKWKDLETLNEASYALDSALTHALEQVKSYHQSVADHLIPRFISKIDVKFVQASKKKHFYRVRVESDLGEQLVYEVHAGKPQLTYVWRKVNFEGDKAQYGRTMIPFLESRHLTQPNMGGMQSRAKYATQAALNVAINQIAASNVRLNNLHESIAEHFIKVGVGYEGPEKDSFLVIIATKDQKKNIYYRVHVRQGSSPDQLALEKIQLVRNEREEKK
jgi:hypothetical protein